MSENRKIGILLLAFVLTLCFGTTLFQNTAQATCLYGIYNNGAYGITIDINAAPYTTYANKSYGQYAYGTAGCAWYASARVNQLTGKGSTIWAGTAWYNSRGEQLGFTKGTSFSTTQKALACYSNHVTVVEGLDSSGNVIISEGGVSSSSLANYGYCRITTMSRSTLESARGGSFIGYVYLGVSMINSQTLPISVSYSDDTLDQPRKTISTTTATMAATISVTGASISSVSTVGFELYNANGSALKSKTETPKPKNGVINAWYSIGSGQEIDVALSSGTTYLYRFLCVINGTTYYGDFKSFTTTAIYVNGITVSPSSLTLKKGNSSSLSVSVSPSNASHKAVNWSSSNEGVATVVNGTVTAVGTGTATITASASDGSGVRGTCSVTVSPTAVTSVSISSQSLVLNVGDSARITSQVYPSDADNQSIVIYSDNDDVAYWDNDTIYAVGAGETTIWFEAADRTNNAKASCSVTVNPTITDIELNRSSITLATEGIGAQFPLICYKTPADGRGTINWISLDPSVALVDQNGLVTAQGAGKTQIHASVSNGPSVSCLVTVQSGMPLLQLPSETLTVGEEAFASIGASRIDLPNGLETISARAFAGNSSLLYVRIPNSVTSIDDTAFDGASKLCILCGHGSVAEAFAASHGIETLNDESASFVYVRSISMDSSRTMGLEDTIQLSAEVLPSNASNPALAWSSSDESIVSVSESGMLTALATGSATITAEAVDGSGKKAQCRVTVTLPNVTVIEARDESRTAMDSTDATIVSNLSIGGVSINRVQKAGIQVYNANGGLLKTRMDDPVLAGDTLSVAYTMSNLGLTLDADTMYRYRFAVIVSGITYYSEYSTFTTLEGYPRIRFSSSSLTISVGDEVQLQPVVEFCDSTDVLYRTSNSSVAYEMNGTLYAAKAGTAVITAYLAEDATVKATLTVTVN